MNPISFNTINYSKNYNMNRQNQVTFKGLRGDEIVNEIIRGVDVKPANIMKEVKGTFGIKSDKFEDIIESLIGKIKQFAEDKNTLTKKLNAAQDEINGFPEKQRDLKFQTENEMRKSFGNVIRAKDEEIAAAKTETKKAKEFAAKYEPMLKVKSIDEIGLVMPEQAIANFKEMAAKKIDARKSMYDFLMTGKGQQEAVAQINRNEIMWTAYQDGMFNIPEFNHSIDDLKKENKIIWSNAQYFTLNMIENSLKGTPNGNYIASPQIEAQVKKNAMALLTPLADERYSNTGIKALETQLDRIFECVKNFHKEFKNALTKFEKKYGKENVEIAQKDFDIDNSVLKIKEKDGKMWECPFYIVANH